MKKYIIISALNALLWGATVGLLNVGSGILIGCAAFCVTMFLFVIIPSEPPAKRSGGADWSNDG